MASVSSCPLKMAYEMMTDMRPRCAVNAELTNMVASQYPGQPFSAYEARRYLQANAIAIMEAERQKSVSALGECAPCRRPLSDSGTMLPEKYVVRCNGVSCARTEVNPAGLGDGRSY